MAANNRDAILLESTTTHRSRLRAAFLFGEQNERRVASDNVRRFVGSVILAAVACAVCIGVSFVTNVLETQAAEKAAQEASSTPTPEPSETATEDPAAPVDPAAPTEPVPEETAPPAEPDAPIPTETP